MSTHYIHFANLLSSSTKFGLDFVRAGRATTLETFWKGNIIAKLLDENPDIKIFLDSGAHSLLNAQIGLISTGDTVKTDKKDSQIFSRNEFIDRLTINQRYDYSTKLSGAAQFFADWSFNKNADVRKYLDNYIAFIHKYKKQLMGYVNLDIIYNAEESWENQKYMESNGLRPIPVFHYGEDFKWWKKYVDNYEYIGIGGVAGGITLQQFVTSLGNKAFAYMESSNPDVKVHGFAVTSVKLVKRFKFYSVDSTTWLKHAVYGNIMVPVYDAVKKEFDYSVPSLVISVSDLSMIKASKHPHYTIAFSTKVVDRIEEYLNSIGIDKEELKTSTMMRRKANVIYFENLLKAKCIREPRKLKSSGEFF